MIRKVFFYLFILYRKNDKIEKMILASEWKYEVQMSKLISQTISVPKDGERMHGEYTNNQYFWLSSWALNLQIHGESVYIQGVYENH